ncbi:multidrug ABC transporter ATP-binding protein [Leuconostoc litchii]|uniref:ABC transporter ATP-binding protein n=1 Tax=Leuconostoc litchii TaxID=1981069 RepID=A0A6P2CP00_9LACO|nr:ABC transporter ATP-binding protein [Leuconostoc litchii]TYC46822.1 ABC transporter ATP-binding protein [Leuconostoc litchii]GMA70715.1 multidrug ABC transporter ATP-binding protein [Leuconostoc litchii]
MGLKINNLSGGYAGNNVLKNITFDVPDGKIVALIGLNGAGKSTTVNHVIGELQPQMGSICLNGTNIVSEPTMFKSQIAYIPEQPILYDELTLGEHLHLMLAAHDIDNETSWTRVASLLTLFRLENKLNWLPIHFSKGMRQKVMLVSAFMLNAPLLIVDEPFLGLDTLAQRDVIQLIQEQARLGNSILITTHLLASAASFVDQFVVLYEGKVRFVGSPSELAEENQLSVNNLDELFDLMQRELANEG